MVNDLLSFEDLVRAELEEARTMYPPHNSLHESYAVILEELEELWNEVKMKPRDRCNARILKELVQIGAMAQRCAEDVVLPRKED